jgi:hypothetical protein
MGEGKDRWLDDPVLRNWLPCLVEAGRFRFKTPGAREELTNLMRVAGQEVGFVSVAAGGGVVEFSPLWEIVDPIPPLAVLIDANLPMSC